MLLKKNKDVATRNPMAEFAHEPITNEQRRALARGEGVNWLGAHFLEVNLFSLFAVIAFLVYAVVSGQFH